MVCSCTHFFRGKATGIIYSGYVSVALGIQHAMRHIKLTSVAFLPVPNLPTLSHKRQVFFFRMENYVVEHEMCFDLFIAFV